MNRVEVAEVADALGDLAVALRSTSFSTWRAARALDALAAALGATILHPDVERGLPWRGYQAA